MKRIRPSRSPQVGSPPEDAVDRVRLLRSRRVGPATWRRLMDEHGCAAAAIRVLPDLARNAGLGDYAPCPVPVAERELRDGAKAGAFPVFLDDPGYPAALASLPDAPPLLWVRGDASALCSPSVAMVGARAASSLGERLARRMSIDLAERGVCVVSGLARGIDAAAHSGALEAGGRTVAVLAGGIDTIYPSEHEELAARIASEGGALVSETPVGRGARAADFPRRNRIVTGLSRGVVVLEAAMRSGSLATARLAAEQGRDVMAVPGHPLDARAAGPNALIREGATLVTGASDVVEALGGTAALLRAATSTPSDFQANRCKTAATAGPVAGRQAAVADGADRAVEPEALSESPQVGRPTGDAEVAPCARDGVGHARDDGQALRLQPAGGETRVDPPHPLAPRTVEAEGVLHDRIRDCLRAPRDEDDLIREMNLPLSVLAPAILALELEGRIERLPGARLMSR